MRRRRVPSEDHSLTRAQVHELLWSRPISQVAPEFGISDVALAKACRKANIPLPPRGYWTKLRSGKAPEQPALPDDKAADDRFLLRRPEAPEWTESDLLYPEPSYPRDLKQRKEALRAELGNISITPLDVETHLELRRVITQHRRSQATSQRKGSYYGRQPQLPSLDSPLGQRRLSIANTVLLALEGRGVHPKILDDEATHFEARIDSVVVAFALEGQTAFVGGLSAEEAASMLSFKVKDPLRRRESKWIWNERKVPLEEQLTDMVVGVLVAAEENRRAVQRDEQWRRRLEHERRTDEEQRRRKAEEAAALEKLEVDAAAFRRASDIRTFVAAVRARSPRDRATREWCEWALEQADKLDPIENGTAIGRPELDEFDLAQFERERAFDRERPPSPWGVLDYRHHYKH